MILVLNGPNLNRLGKREPEVYGSTTLADVETALHGVATRLGVQVTFLQSNHEGALIDALHDADDRGYAGVIFNPGGYTHTSVALRDAVSAISVPVVEVHISNVFAREDFRRTSYLSAVCAGVMSGFGTRGYELALHFLAEQ